MAYTQVQIDALKAAIAIGARSVAHNGKTVTYHSVSEMQSLVDRMERELQGASPRRTLAHYAKFSRGS